jgi:hypothetical protein
MANEQRGGSGNFANDPNEPEYALDLITGVQAAAAFYKGRCMRPSSQPSPNAIATAV